MVRIYLCPSGLHRHVATMSSILSLMEMAATSALSEAWREARAQALFNRRDKPAEAEVLWSEASLTGSRSVRDLWAHKNLGEFNDMFSASVPPHGAVPLRVEAILR